MEYLLLGGTILVWAAAEPASARQTVSAGMMRP
jgi:hypothetical protein